MHGLVGVVNLAPSVGVVDLTPPVGVVNLAPPVGVVNLTPPVGVVDLGPAGLYGRPGSQLLLLYIFVHVSL